MINNTTKNQEAYLSLLKYEKGKILLDGKDLAKYANMDSKYQHIFYQLVEYILYSYNFWKCDDFEIIKGYTVDSCVSSYSFEVKTKANLYDKLKKYLFDFAYFCCSNLPNEEDVDYDYSRNQYNFDEVLYLSQRLFNDGVFHTIYSTGYEKFDIASSEIKVTEEEYQEQYQQFLIAPSINDSNYYSLLTYQDGELLLDGKDLAKYANMNNTSVHIFFDLLDQLLTDKHYADCQIIKTKYFTDKSYKYSQELIVKSNLYEELKKTIFNFAYLCCSNVANEKFFSWKMLERSLQEVLKESEDVITERKIHAICPSSFDDCSYGLKLSDITVNEEELQEQYEYFLKKNPVQNKKKELIKK